MQIVAVLFVVLRFLDFCSSFVLKMHQSLTRWHARSCCFRLASSIKQVQEGKFGEKSFKTFFKNVDGKIISPWHDIPLRMGSNYNFICEIPKYSREKMEVNTSMKHNPITQDLLASGDVRSYHGPIFWNYGCFPQTWENPFHLHPVIHKYGDNDPLDVVEIGSIALPVGDITEVKVLGVLAMVDKGELDWKVIAIRIDDALAAEFNDISDVVFKQPHVVNGIREWFRWYKAPDGKPLNTFAFDEKALSKVETEGIIQETHQYWSDLVTGKVENKGKLWIG